MFTCLFYQKIKDQTDQKLPQGSYRKPNAEYCQKIIDFEFLNDIWTIRHTSWFLKKVILFKNINMKENPSQGATEGYIKLFWVVETFTS